MRNKAIIRYKFLVTTMSQRGHVPALPPLARDHEPNKSIIYGLNHHEPDATHLTWYLMS